MLTVATVITLLIVAPAGMFVGALIERRRHRAAWEQATDQAIQVTQTIRDADQQQWAEVARALAPIDEYRGYN